MTKKQKAALVAAVLAVLGALAAGGKGLATSDALVERVRAVEVRQEVSDKDFRERLDRIERKLDRLIERK